MLIVVVGMIIHRTVLKQTAEICVHGVPLIGDLLESILVGNYGPTVSTVGGDCMAVG